MITGASRDVIRLLYTTITTNKKQTDLSRKNFSGITTSGMRKLFFMGEKQTKVGFEPPESDSFTSTVALTTRLSGFCQVISNNRF